VTKGSSCALQIHPELALPMVVVPAIEFQRPNGPQDGALEDSSILACQRGSSLLG